MISLKAFLILQTSVNYYLELLFYAENVFPKVTAVGLEITEGEREETNENENY